MVLKSLRIYARGVGLAQVRSDLDRTMDHGIVFDKSANETNDDEWRDNHRCHRHTVCCADKACRDRVSGGRDKAKNDRNIADRSADVVTHNLLNHNNIKDGCAAN
jgi:hypothetical protein